MPRTRSSGPNSGGSRFFFPFKSQSQSQVPSGSASSSGASSVGQRLRSRATAPVPAPLKALPTPPKTVSPPPVPRSAGAAGTPRGRPRRVEPVTIPSDLTVLLALIAFRVLNALVVRTFFQPDEFYQSLEPAWQLAFGEGQGAWLTWVSLLLGYNGGGRECVRCADEFLGMEEPITVVVASPTVCCCLPRGRFARIRASIFSCDASRIARRSTSSCAGSYRRFGGLLHVEVCATVVWGVVSEDMGSGMILCSFGEVEVGASAKLVYSWR